MVLSGRKLYYTINIVAGMAIFFFGYDQGMMGGVNTAPDYVKTMRLGYSKYGGAGEGVVAEITKPFRQGGIVCIYYLGALIGALMGGTIGDRIGRIKTMALGGAWVCLGASLQCSAQNITWMLIARVINGIGTGHLNAIVPVWSAECATHTSRGAFIALEFTLNIFGVVVAYWLEFGLGFVGNGDTQIRWRFPIAFQIIPVLFFMLSLFWMPESPRWLLKVGRNDEARSVLQRLRVRNATYDANSTGGDVNAAANAEYEQILQIVELEQKHKGRNSYWNMFWGTGYGDLHMGRRVQLSIWLQIMQEWVGIAAITIYAPIIFAQAGYGPRKAQWLSGLNDITYMLSTALAVLTIDRWGRRIGLYWGAVGQGIAMFLAGAFAKLLGDHSSDPKAAAVYGGAAAAFIFLYTAVFGATWLTIPWVYPTETFPLEVRARGNAWGVVGWSIGNGWLTLLNPVMFSHIKYNTYHVYGAVNFLTIPIIWAFYPETANRTLEEIDLLFASKSIFVWEEEAHFQRLKADLASGRLNEHFHAADDIDSASEPEKLQGKSEIPSEV